MITRDEIMHVYDAYAKRNIAEGPRPAEPRALRRVRDCRVAGQDERLGGTQGPFGGS